jgi:hypothetical protein
MNDNQIADVWLLFKEYIDRKEVAAIAEKYVDLLADYGVKDRVLEGARGVDADLDHAIEYYLEADEEEIIEEYEDLDDEEEDY